MTREPIDPSTRCTCTPVSLGPCRACDEPGPDYYEEGPGRPDGHATRLRSLAQSVFDGDWSRKQVGLATVLSGIADEIEAAESAPSQAVADRQARSLGDALAVLESLVAVSGRACVVLADVEKQRAKEIGGAA